MAKMYKNYKENTVIFSLSAFLASNFMCLCDSTAS